MRVRGWNFLALLAFTIAAGANSFAPAADVGSKAPAVEPSKWLNTKADLSWSTLKGRVILVEKWATT